MIRSLGRSSGVVNSTIGEFTLFTVAEFVFILAFIFPATLVVDTTLTLFELEVWIFKFRDADSVHAVRKLKTVSTPIRLTIRRILVVYPLHRNKAFGVWVLYHLHFGYDVAIF